MKNGNNSDSMADLTAFPSRKVTKELCDMCGEEPPTKVIWDPNKFPGGEDNDVWEVCKDCKGFIEMGIIDGYKFQVCMKFKEKGQEPPEELKPSFYDKIFKKDDDPELIQ